MTSEKQNKGGFWKHAFGIEKPEDFKADEKDIKILDALAGIIVKRGLAVPSILFLESARPMNFIGASAMAFFEPIVRAVFPTWDGYTRFYQIMEKRGSVNALIERIELAEQKRQEAIKQNKAKAKENDRNSKHSDSSKDKT